MNLRRFALALSLSSLATIHAQTTSFRYHYVGIGPGKFPVQAA